MPTTIRPGNSSARMPSALRSYGSLNVVAGDAAAQPQHLAHAQVVGKHPLIVLPRHAGVALLHLAEQALLRGQQESLPVHVDATSLKHDTAAVECRLPRAQVQRLANLL